MNPALSLKLLTALSLHLTARALVADDAPKPDSTLEIIQFKAPAGWNANAAAAAAPARSELEALDKQKQELLPKIAEIEARQRQLSATITGGAAPAGDAAAALNANEQLLAKAREKFAKDLATRRKPHTILGDILGLDGKPIPNVISYNVYVWGTTVAAEKTHYGLDVDQNDHFEQQVPDGLYKIKATCLRSEEHTS